MLLGIGLASFGASPPGASGQSGSSRCAGAAVALGEGGLDQAREEYLDVLASTPSSDCAIQGLRNVTLAARAEGRLCKEGKALAEAKQEPQARQRYVAALGKNSASDCATKGLGGTKKEVTDQKTGLEKASSTATTSLALVGSVLVALLVLVGAVLLLLTLLRRRKPSLAIEPFVDSAVEPKVGSAVAGLVQARLVALSRHGRRSTDSYQLDLVVADIEILATNESLDNALSGLADAPQFKLAVAVLGLIDRTFGTHLVANGELAPSGSEGHGLLLSLHSQRPGTQARGVLWQPVAVAATPAESAVPSAQRLTAPPPPRDVQKPPATDKKPSDDAKTDPDPYYKLVERAAAWIQYEAACGLDSRVGLMTTSAESFSLVAEGLAEQRADRLGAAARRYVEALQVDPENVAALFNLSLILARVDTRFRSAATLLSRARAILESRYEQLA